MPIHQWPTSERPREKLIQKGVASLSDAELLAIFLRTGVRGSSAVDLARQLIDDHGSLQALFKANKRQFCQSKGVGPAKYVQLQAVLEMARRYFWEDLERSPKLSSAAQVREYLLMKMSDLPKEVFSCMFLNSQYQLINYEELFSGTVNQAPVYPREVAKRALDNNAAAVILAHNHPSGECHPSRSDRQITEVICDALALLDIRVLDHFIIGKQQVYSFAEHGLL